MRPNLAYLFVIGSQILHIMIQANPLIKEINIQSICGEELCYAVKKMQNKKCPGTGQNPFRSKGAVDKATQSRRTFLLLVVKF